MIHKRKNGSYRITGNDANEFVKHLRGDYKVIEFNKKYKVGETVIVLDDEGKQFVDTIKAPASILGGHTAVAWLEGKGSYRIDRIIDKQLHTF